jgi:aspartate 1-decarboxylase
MTDIKDISSQNDCSKNQGTRLFMYGKIHRCRVTEANLDYVGSITIDPVLLTASGLIPYTAVDVVNITTGGRLQTYIIPGTPYAGEICLNGAAAHLFKKDDLAIIMGYENVPADQLVGRESKAVMVNDIEINGTIMPNQLLEVFTYTTPSFEDMMAGRVPSRAHESYDARLFHATNQQDKLSA